MNEPIINPLFFYLIDMTSRVQAVAIFVAVFFGVSFVLYVCCAHADSADIRKRVTFPLLIAIALSFFLLVLTPSKSGLISMVVANEITYERLDLAISGGLNIKETIKADIVDIFEAINSKESDQ